MNHFVARGAGELHLALMIMLSSPDVGVDPKSIVVAPDTTPGPSNDLNNSQHSDG